MKSRNPTSIVFFYAGFSSLWILFSDRLVDLLALPTYINTVKGWFFVLITSLLLHALIQRHEQNRTRQQCRLSDSEARFRTIFDSINDAVFIHDAQTGAILDVNARMLTLYGYDRAEALNLTVQDLSTGQAPYTQDQALDWMRKARDEGPQVFEWLCRNREGQEFWCEVAMRQAALDGQDRILVLVRDIGERKMAQEALIAGKEAAEEASRTKSEFLATMSHETRTPLSGVIGMLTLMDQDRLDPENAQYLEMARFSANTLLGVINQILDFAKIETGTLEIRETPFVLAEVFQKVAASQAAEAKAKGLDILIETDPAVPLVLSGDGERLVQALANLMENAVKFTTHGTATLKAVLAPALKEDRARVQFTVSDTGIGIPEDKLHSIFEPFTQVDSTYARKYHGTGLGLGIASRLVRAMGGELVAQSALGVGTSLTFTLDLAVLPEAQAEVLLQTEVAPARSLRLLVVEDERINQVGLARTLERLGHIPTCVGDGESALAALSRESFDAVIMDIQMPGMDGMETTRLIRSSGQPYAHTPIVALTAHAMPGDREEFLDAGMDAYLAKPVDPDRLRDQLARLAG